MSEAKHTPGPWKLVPWQDDPRSDSGDLLRIVGSNGSEVCYFGNPDSYYPTSGTEPSDQDARLIAAAPDLLAACEMVIKRWTFDVNQQHTHTWHGLTDCAVVICAAIAKATGAAT